MITPEIVLYIKNEREKQTPEATIRANLLANGWSEVDITEAFSSFTSTTPVPKPPVSTIELAKFRRERKWTVFGITTAISLILLGIPFFASGQIEIQIVLTFIPALAVFYFASHIATRSISIPTSTGWAVLQLIGLVIGTFLISWVIALGIFFAFCLFSLAGYMR